MEADNRHVHFLIPCNSNVCMSPTCKEASALGMYRHAAAWVVLMCGCHGEGGVLMYGCHGEGVVLMCGYHGEEWAKFCLLIFLHTVC